MSFIQASCCCCHSPEGLIKLCGTTLDVYSLICNLQSMKNGVNQMMTCLQCRDFLKRVHSFRIEDCGADESFHNNPDVKFQKVVDVKAEIIDELRVVSDTGNLEEVSKSFPESLFECDHCKKCFRTEHNFLNHKLIHSKDRPFKCRECSYETTTSWNLKTHISHKHDYEKSFSCDQCNYRFNNERQRNIHKMTHLKASDKPYKCSECSFTTTTKKYLKFHVARKHANDKIPFACDQCNYCTIVKSDLVKHKEIHSEGRHRPFKCSECSYAAAIKKTLTSHIARKHDAKKPFACDQCDYRCMVKWELLRHEKKHSQDRHRPYKCGECSYAATTLGHLKSHVAYTHRDEKPYSCDRCIYRSSRKDRLTAHMKRHLNGTELYYECNDCSYTATNKKSLRKHMVEHGFKHNYEKTFACDYCDYRCNRRGRLIVHKNRHFNGDELPTNVMNAHIQLKTA